MRSGLLFSRGMLDFTWFGPAPTGRSVSVLGAPSEGPDQPRACGEKCEIPHLHEEGLGSSPRLRGEAKPDP